ncbi:MAG: MptD family putative ECF transporter S component [Actinomycetaceae bacterium]|nr:MptD family putative ECF transporter S component [Actinomycetaceae bacterium]
MSENVKQQNAQASKGIGAKDLINLGVFVAINFVIGMAVGMLGFIPIFIPLLIVIWPLIGGVAVMLYYSKVRTFGLVTLFGLLSGLLMFIGGMGLWIIGTLTLSGLIADLILKAGGYNAAKNGVLAFAVFSVGIIGNYIPIIVSRDEYMKGLRDSGFTQDYVNALNSFLPSWMLIVLIIGGFVAGLVGGFIGKKVLAKNFKRAGLA